MIELLRSLDPFALLALILAILWVVEAIVYDRRIRRSYDRGFKDGVDALDRLEQTNDRRTALELVRVVRAENWRE